MDNILSVQEIDRLFTYHAPVGDQPQRYERIRAKAKALAVEIATSCPASADRTAAIRKLREAVQTANASIALEPRAQTEAVPPDAPAPGPEFEPVGSTK